MMFNLKNISLSLSTLLITGACTAQDTARNLPAFTTLPAGAQYKKPKFYQSLWGRNRRTEWITPVRVPVANLDSFYGGLHPYQQGGGNETKSLRLRSTDGKEFTLRSINKSRKEVVLPEFRGTFVAGIIQDEVSMSYPYAAFALPEMQEHAGIPHTTPLLVYVPSQPALDTFSKKFGDDLYLLEQRPDGDWSSSDNMGRFKKFVSTDKVIEKLLEDNSNRADQYAFVKARLFDMLISDWDRHEDNWRWGVADTAGRNFYTPVPRDRDQAFYTRNGILISRVMSLTELNFMQNFSYRVKDIKMLNVEQRNMDRFFTNRMNGDDWENAARELQQALSDSAIVQSVKGVPPEIFNISGEELVDKLKSRRGQLPAFAKKYYRFLAKEVEVTGSRTSEYFEVKKSNTGETIISVFDRSKHLTGSDSAFYRRAFFPSETREVRLYGVDGEDVFAVYDKSEGIKLRIIGGPREDSIADYSGKRIHIYDNHNNRFKASTAKLHLSDDSSVNVFKYEGYDYNIRHLVPYILFNSRDRWYFGLNYSFLKHRWRKEPYANTGTAGINYYGANRAIVASLSILYPALIGKWDLTLYGSHDALKWTNFFGTGNETVLSSDDRTYNRVRSINYTAKAGISKATGKSTIAIFALFQRAKILNDTSRYIAKVLQNATEFRPNYYIGAQVNYSYLTLNDSVVPTKGFTFLASAAGYRNVTLNDFFQNYSARAQACLPVAGKVSIALRAGIETIVGTSSIVNNAQFYQHAIIGGPVNIRGFRAERFWGKTSFYNQNELRFITNIRTHLINAKAGLLAFFDDGRVWLPQESSHTFHTSYGGGIMIAPFYKISASVTYGITNESRLVQVGINTLF